MPLPPLLDVVMGGSRTPSTGTRRWWSCEPAIKAKGIKGETDGRFARTIRAHTALGWMNPGLRRIHAAKHHRSPKGQKGRYSTDAAHDILVASV